MTLLKSINTVSIAAILTGCQFLPVQPENTENAAIKEQAKPIVDQSIHPLEDELARNWLGNTANIQLASLSDATLYRLMSTGVTRPDPSAKYPDDLYQVMRRNFEFDLTLV